MTDRFTAACVQTTSGREVAPNIAAVSSQIRAARDAGADFIMTPETTDMMEPKGPLREEKLRPEADHAGVAAFAALASELDCWLLIGSMVVAPPEGKPVNRSYLFDPNGAIAARYEKIHMFDVDVPDGQSYRESSAYQAGGRAVTAELPWGRLGMTVCYDLRFPQLYHGLAQAGAAFLTIPSAFTRFTGKAHWHSLLRARAIETGSFVFAPAQCGEHAEGRETYGHSLIIGPWGEILAEAGEAPGVILAEIDPAASARARHMIPALAGTREFVGPDIALQAAGS